MIPMYYENISICELEDYLYEYEYETEQCIISTTNEIGIQNVVLSHCLDYCLYEVMVPTISVNQQSFCIL